MSYKHGNRSGKIKIIMVIFLPSHVFEVFHNKNEKVLVQNLFSSLLQWIRSLTFRIISSNFCENSVSRSEFYIYINVFGHFSLCIIHWMITEQKSCDPGTGQMDRNAVLYLHRVNPDQGVLFVNSLKFSNFKLVFKIGNRSLDPPDSQDLRFHCSGRSNGM